MNSLALALVAHVVRHPPRRIHAFLKAHPRFRVREGVLVRWAYEDLALEANGDPEGEEDTMVNAADTAYAGDEEQIPLKPSPRHGRGRGKVLGYGTAK